MGRGAPRTKNKPLLTDLWLERLYFRKLYLARKFEHTCTCIYSENTAYFSFIKHMHVKLYTDLLKHFAINLKAALPNIFVRKKVKKDSDLSLNMSF